MPTPIKARSSLSLAPFLLIAVLQAHPLEAAGERHPCLEGTRADFSCTLATDATREAVWALWMDVDGWKRWDLGLADARLETSMGPSARGVIVPLDGPEASFEVVTYEEGERYAFETSLPFARLRVERVLHPPAAGERTRLTHHVSFAGPLGWFFARMLGGDFMAALPPTMERLLSLAEAEGSA